MRWISTLILCLILIGNSAAQEASTYEPRQVKIRARGAEVFPMPDRTVGRKFAVQAGRFQPYLGGVSDDGEFYLIFYFERGEAELGWVPLDQLDLTDWEYEELLELPIILPEDLPYLPKLNYTPSADRHRGR